MLAIDRGVYFQLSAAQQKELVNTVTAAGGYITLIRDLRSIAIENAREIAKDLAVQ